MGVVAVGAGLGALSGYAVGKSSARSGREYVEQKKPSATYTYHFVNDTDHLMSYRCRNESDPPQVASSRPMRVQPGTRRTFVATDSSVTVAVTDLVTGESATWHLSAPDQNEVVLTRRK